MLKQKGTVVSKLFFTKVNALLHVFVSCACCECNLFFIPRMWNPQICIVKIDKF